MENDKNVMASSIRWSTSNKKNWPVRTSRVSVVEMLTSKTKTVPLPSTSVIADTMGSDKNAASPISSSISTKKNWPVRTSRVSVVEMLTNSTKTVPLTSASLRDTMGSDKNAASPISSTTSAGQSWPASTPGVPVVVVLTSSIKKVPVSSASVIADTMGSENNIDSFIENITNLDFKDISSLNKSLAMMEILLTSMKPTDYSTNHNPLTASKVLEEFALRYIDYHWNGAAFYYNQRNIVLQGEKCYPGNDSYKFGVSGSDGEESTIILPKENFVTNGTLILSIAFKRMHYLMEGQSYKLQNDRYELKSRIISTSIKPKRQNLKINATMVFKISPQSAADSESKKECVFWRFSTTREKDAGWSRDGCIVTSTTGEHVECSCNHLTHFAVLMRTDNKKLSRNEDAILTTLTKFGLGLSIVGCVITFLSYWFFTEAKSEQSQIRMNLVFVLAVAHILFLLGSAARFHLVVCVSVAVLLQLFYTSALCWMFAEGIQLYMQVIKVFNTNLKMRQVYGFAWGFPLLLITVSLSIAGNGSGGLSSFVNDDFCWLSVDNHLIWTFIAPVILLILSNLIVLGMVVKEMNRINQPIGDQHGKISLRSSIKALIVLAPLLGVTWLMGLLCILGADVIGLYIFTILNSTQGFLIFVFHCWRNSEIQGKFRRKVQALEENRPRQDNIFHVYNYRHRGHVKKEAFTKIPTISKRPKARKQSPGGLTISDFDPSDFVEFNASTKL
ncbi:adhesion G protein-coupled receptor L4-like [Actinia tenebrosa]|uniref:Adhesion G protein-coupled receptor L4-like n=1 Tax=Actinia tenebrosa TaxID=6105 RepID=A0A6P8HTN0_ACTTE|nr:adhesion G protein-coupled receptor L4-like [Actinia tenebrosa]